MARDQMQCNEASQRNMDVLEKYQIGQGFESVRDREKDLPNPS